METNIRVNKIVCVLVEEDRMLRIFKSGFTRPQYYYALEETPYDEPQATHTAIPYLLKDISEMTNIPEQEIELLFE
jgi:hypothetical protein